MIRNPYHGVVPGWGRIRTLVANRPCGLYWGRIGRGTCRPLAIHRDAGRIASPDWEIKTVDSSFYREQIMDHYRNPRYRGRLAGPTASYEELNPLCGDMIHIDLAIADGHLVDARFDGHGCAVSQASASMLLEEVVGKPIAEVAALDRDDLFALIGVTLSPARMKCALLPLAVLRAALRGGMEN
jgi:nitrogen fixation NifU-like protein